MTKDRKGKMGCTQKDVRVAESEQTDKAVDCVSDKSLQVCHCGWSKVTTYQGLRTHQGKMGCTRKDVRVAESEQTDKAAYCFPGEHLRVCHCGWSKVTTYQGLRTHQGKMGCTRKDVRVAESEQTDKAAYCFPGEHLRVCHCGWSKVTTYQGLRIHQGRMGCTQRGVRGAGSEQQNMWGNVGLPNKQQNLWVDIYTSIKTDTTDCSSQTSLQVCHCGWTQVTTYQGLRTHQGKMGCTQRGVRGAESKQQNMWGSVGLYTSVKTETTAGCSSDKSLQVCHCGWKKETTYRGLRIHQGKMGCTPKGMRIPATEQHDWKNPLEDVNQKKLQPALKVIIKKEDVPSPPRIDVCTKSASLTAPIKEEYEASAIPHRSATLSSPQSAVVRPKKKKRKDQTSPQVNGSIRERPTIYPIPAVRAKEKTKNDQILLQVADRGAMTGYAAKAATIKEEPHTPFAIQQQPFQTATNSKSGHELHDSSSGVQVNRSVRERPTLPPRPTVVPPKKKEGEDQTPSQVNRSIRERPTIYPIPAVRAKEKTKNDQILSQVNRSVRERPTLPPRPTVVPPKKEGKDQTPSQVCAAKAIQERLKSELELKIQMREEKLQKKAAEKVCESVPDSTSATTQTNTAAADAISEEDPKSLNETAQDSDFSTGMKVKQLALMFSATTKKTAAVQQPKEKPQEEQKLPQAKPLVQRFLDATAQETAVQQPKEKHEKEQKLPQPLAQKFLAATAQETAVQPKKQDKEDQKLSPMPDSTSATTKMNPAVTEDATKEDPKALSETAQLSDCSTGLKVKQLAWMFSATNQETAAQLKEKHQEEHKPAQVKPLGQKLLKPLAQKFLAATAQETAVQPKKQDREDQKLSLMPDSTSATTKMNPAAAEAARTEDPKSSCETAQLCDFSTELKVPDTTSATTKMNPAVTEDATKEDPKALSETAQLSDCSTGLKVKQLAWMFSATNQETAAQLKEKHQEERKPAQVKPLGQKLSAATAQETAKGKERDDQKLSQVRQDRIPDDVKHMVEMRERNGDEDRSSVKACKPLQESLDCRPVETNSELSKVMEDACQKSLDLKISNETLRNTKLIKVGQIHQKLEKPYSNDLEWITKFAVDIKLDPTTAHRCLISADGKEVRDEQETDVADAPERFDLCGSVLGLNKFTSWKSYWEVEVSNKTGWDLGVARGDANRKGKLLLRPDDGYWAIVHFKNKEYAALTAPPVPLLFKENLQKVGVFVDYEGGLVSFYNVTAKSHIYSFTLCSFTGEICPYFSLHLGESADPLIISTVKHQ
ncbi:serine/arginine repetitive matrix protein 1-like isoform X4 [Thunnus maccoyii]|uniref:serine/arginine repetitive matrix protein 1-like isoform X4 n=1 Tax=Thunnus maccoyii TaxID=8240 RepID=UPI001C4C7141|nr:serine/arginine repetitive matrix protein 1-like isoform X4 [Thunnus maccoyii]